MATRHHLKAAVLLAVLAASLDAVTTRADIYVWTDAAGVTQVSNLPPPAGSLGVSVTRSSPRDAAQEAAAREAARLAEVRALDDRVRQLEAEAEQARREAALAIAVAQPRYIPAAASPPVVVVVASTPPPAPAYGPTGFCDVAWGNCAWGAWPGFHSPGFVVVGSAGRHRPHHPGHHPHPNAHVPRPWHAAPFTMPEPVHPFPFPKPAHWRK